MTDNYHKITEYFKSFKLLPAHKDEQNDYFFSVRIIRRGKDYPDLPSANLTYATYYFTNFEKFARFESDIKKLCDVLGCRAYVSTTLYSCEKLIKQINLSAATRINIGDNKSPWSIVEHSADVMPVKLRRWVVDMDDVEEGSDKVIQMCDIIRSCDCGVKDPITFLNKTRSGVHIITHPFNLKQFTGNLSALGIEAPEIKKNHITLLYENL